MSETVVPSHYTDAFERRHEIPPEVRGAILAAMELEPGEDPPGAGTVAITRRGDALPAGGTLVLEDGTDLGRRTRLPADAPYGYHHLLRDDGIDQLLITGPGRCHLPRGLRAWGWAVQLAAARSRHSWGIGDLDDLRSLAEWSASVGAGFLAVSPLGAPNPGPAPEPSPYYPSTRRFGNPLHLSVEAIAGDAEATDLGRAARRLNADRRVDRGAVLEYKLAALERAWDAGLPDHDALDAWRREQGEPLERWSRFALLSERHGPGWQAWPDALRDPSSPQVAAAASESAERVAFHAWLQWCFDRQLADASLPLRRIADMPVGVDPGGFDAWDWQDQLAIGATVGAPPDRFNAAGQDWGLPPFIPHRLRQARYRPFIDTIRAQLRHAGGLRIDHVLGLFRLWWLPGGVDPARGAYVNYPTDELLEIVALESHRARAVVIGEDLGTVPSGVREELRRRSLLSTRLVLFERTPPSRYPRQALAAVTTHDLPTIAGTISGSDLEDQRRAGIDPDAENLELLRARLRATAGTRSDRGRPEALIPAVHRALAASPSALVAATLEDALAVEERTNLPGTVAPQRDNWSLALPAPIEELGTRPGVAALVEALQR